MGRAIRTRKWEYSVRAPGLEGNWQGDSDVYAEEFLYDVEKDPYERNNLVNDPSLAEVRSQLAEGLKQRMIKAGEKAPGILPAK